MENPGKATEGDSLYDAPAEHPSPAAQQNRHTWRKVGIRHYKDDIQRRFPFLSFRVFYRFREVYYWDTYWIVAGLLACHMVETARYFESHCVEYSLYCCLSMCYSFPLE